MFVYENKNKELCITFKDNKPVSNPEYVIDVDTSTQSIVFNGMIINPYKTEMITEDVVFETAKEISTPVSIELAKGVVVSIPEDTEGSGVYHVTKGGSLIINGDGIINGVGKNDYNMAIWADGGNVTINGGTFTNVGASSSNDPEHFDLIYAKNGGTVIINEGYFECETPKWTLNLNDGNPGKIIVRGGTFVDFDPSNAETEPGGSYNFVDTGYTVVRNANLYTVVKE